ncbi:MAG: pyrroline-5-carboxylate reductase [Pseudomonadota bacterium]
MTQVVLIGAGNMGFAMLKGWLAAPEGRAFTVVEPVAALRARAEAAGARAVATPAEAPKDPDLIVLAVKPQVLADAAAPYREFPGAVMSVAAGVTLDRLEAAVGPRPIVRVMPNTPSAIGQGMSVSCANAGVSVALRALVDALLAATGQTAWIEDEALMDAVTAISGSGPAYVFHFIEALAAAGEALGLEAPLAARLALQTVAGAGALAAASETPPAALREAVTSPGGTTAAALGVLRDTGALSALLADATRAARDRGRAL